MRNLLAFRWGVVIVIFGLLTACTSVDPLPTLAPFPTDIPAPVTLAPTDSPTDSPTPIPSLPPTATEPVSRPTPEILLTATLTLPPVAIGTSISVRFQPTPPPIQATLTEGTLTLTFTAEQLNYALLRRFGPGVKLDRPPMVRLTPGQIALDISLDQRAYTLLLTPSVISTITGSHLELKAVSITPIPNQPQLLQLKTGHTLLQSVLDVLINTNVRQPILAYTGVSVSEVGLTMTVRVE